MSCRILSAGKPIPTAWFLGTMGYLAPVDITAEAAAFLAVGFGEVRQVRALAPSLEVVSEMPAAVLGAADSVGAKPRCFDIKPIRGKIGKRKSSSGAFFITTIGTSISPRTSITGT